MAGDVVLCLMSQGVSGRFCGTSPVNHDLLCHAPHLAVVTVMSPEAFR